MHQSHSYCMNGEAAAHGSQPHLPPQTQPSGPAATVASATSPPPYHYNSTAPLSHQTSFYFPPDCPPDCPVVSDEYRGPSNLGSLHSVDVCGATHSRPASYGRAVPNWGDGRTRSTCNIVTVTNRGGGSSTFSLDGGALGPLDPLLPPPLPDELEEHLRTCRCQCDHMGYGSSYHLAGDHHHGPPPDSTQTLPLPNGPSSLGRKCQDQVSFGTLPRINSDPSRGGFNIPINSTASLGRRTGSGTSINSRKNGNIDCNEILVRSTGLGGSIGSVIGLDLGGTRSLTGSLTRGKSNSQKGSPVVTPIGVRTPTSYRRIIGNTANHRGAAVAVSGQPPRYEVSEYTFEREQPDSPYSEEKDSEEKKKGGLAVYTVRHWCVLAAVLLLCVVVVLAVAVPLARRSTAPRGPRDALERVHHVLSTVPLIDGHNDLAWNVRNFVHNKLEKVDLGNNLSTVEPWGSSQWSHTDLARLRHGRVGAQFWAVYVPCEAQFKNVAHVTLEQIDVIKRIIARYPHYLGYADSHDSLLEVFKSGRTASLMGMEGGHLMGASLSVLRMYYDLGIRYLSLTHTCNTPWADASLADNPGKQPENFGLNDFGAKVVLEMNRLGMMVDLSHVSQQTMRDALAVSRAPIIFSHSSAQAICHHTRNVPDDILKQVHLNGGIVMVDFYNPFLTCNETATAADVVKHINHIRDVAGLDHVGIGADFDGINKVPTGLEDVGHYPALLAEVLKDGTWSDEDLAKLAGENFLRVMKDNEKVRDELRSTMPYEDHIHPDNMEGKRTCWYTAS